MFQTKVVEEIKTYFMINTFFFPFENRMVYKMWKNTVKPGRPQMTILLFIFENRTDYKMWKNIVKPGRPQMTILRLRTACWITKPTNTHSIYVVLIVFPLQQWLHECAAICLSFILRLN
jgi:hypothetical protein